MPTEAKQATVAELKEELSNAKATIVADYRGLTVSDISAVRRNLRGEGITYRVVKNRLAKIAAQEAGNSELRAARRAERPGHGQRRRGARWPGRSSTRSGRSARSSFAAPS